MRLHEKIVNEKLVLSVFFLKEASGPQGINSKSLVNITVFWNECGVVFVVHECSNRVLYNSLPVAAYPYSDLPPPPKKKKIIIAEFWLLQVVTYAFVPWELLQEILTSSMFLLACYNWDDLANN